VSKAETTVRFTDGQRVWIHDGDGEGWCGFVTVVGDHFYADGLVNCQINARGWTTEFVATKITASKCDCATCAAAVEA
jgi:hypothetical protein